MAGVDLHYLLLLKALKENSLVWIKSNQLFKVSEIPPFAQCYFLSSLMVLYLPLCKRFESNIGYTLFKLVS